MGWRILYIENASAVRLYLDNIRIESTNGELTVPLSDIHTLVIDNQMITITIPLIVKCCEYNINFIICSLEHMPVSTISPFIGNYQSPLMLKKQIQWSDHTKMLLWQKIIKNKISNQKDLLKYLDLNPITNQILIDYEKNVLENDKSNREGLAAKVYFHELFGLDFRRFDDDIINAGLNYGYAILRSQISKTVIAKGLNPCLGIFHKGYDNPFNLSDDIIEVFRPLIDQYAYRNLRDAIIFTKKNRIELIELTGKDAIINFQKQTIFNVISMFIDKIIYIFETGDIESYIPVRLIYEL